MSAALAGLDAHARRLAGASLPDLIDDDPRRARDFSLRVGPLYANFARQRYDRLALDALFALADARDLAGAMRRLLDGDIVNPTEGRAALHTALRGDASDAPAARDARRQALDAQWRMRALADALAAGEVTDIVSIGIGGSDLGPRLVVDALAQPDARFRVHFLSNVDGNAARRVLAALDPRRTAAIDCAVRMARPTPRHAMPAHSLALRRSPKIAIDDTSQLDCLVRNLSDRGALISVSHTKYLPNEIGLTIPDLNFDRRARIVWRRAHSIGVTF